MAPLRLNFACGPTCWPDFENSDIHGLPGTTLVDLRQTPYPYADGVADVIMISHALATTTAGVPFDLSAILGEFHRILQPGGWLRINDSPLRIYRDDEQIGDGARAEEARSGYPPELRMRRDDLIALLLSAGFARASEVSTAETQVQASEQIRYALTHNHGTYLSFAVEAQKGEEQNG